MRYACMALFIQSFLTLFFRTPQEVAQYFPLPQVLNGLFACAERLFGVRVSPARASDSTGADAVSTWHADVMAFDVADAANGRRLARFFLDPFSRETKRAGAWMNNLVNIAPEGGAARLPVAVLVCNFAPAPDTQTPPLLTFKYVWLFPTFCFLFFSLSLLKRSQYIFVRSSVLLLAFFVSPFF